MTSLRTDIEELKRRLPFPHKECEDPWYSCPKHPEYIGNDSQEHCNCGADKLNAILPRLIAQVERMEHALKVIRDREDHPLAVSVAEEALAAMDKEGGE